MQTSIPVSEVASEKDLYHQEQKYLPLSKKFETASGKWERKVNNPNHNQFSFTL